MVEYFNNVTQNNNMVQNNNNIVQNMNMIQNNNMAQNMNMIQNMNMAQNMNNFGNMNMSPYMFNNMVQNMNLAQNSKKQNTDSNKVDEKNKEFLNLIVNFQGRNINIQMSEDRKFSEFAQSFYNKAGLQERVIFLIYSQQLSKDDNRTLKELKLKNNSKIDVVLYSAVIGA